MSKDLEAALMTGDFDAVKGVALALGSQAREDLRTAPDPQSRQKVFEDAVECLTNALSLARVLRAHLASRFQDNSSRLRYQDERAETHRWQFLA